jgi:DNA-binding IclR family transcriptional regulator
MSRERSSMLEKAALVLHAFIGGTPMSLAALGRGTGLSRSTVHRLVVELIELGWIERTGSRYELGMRLFELGELVPAKHRLRTVGLPYMQDLFAATGETIHLAVREGADAVYVEKLHGHSAVRLPSRTGGRAPLTCTAVGKALLAYEGPHVLQDVLRRPLRQWTERSINDPDLLVKQLAEVRRTGLAWEREEAVPGGACLAAPILVGKRAVAALSVSMPVDRFRPEQLGPAVITASLALARTLAKAASMPGAPETSALRDRMGVPVVTVERSSSACLE